MPFPDQPQSPSEEGVTGEDNSEGSSSVTLAKDHPGASDPDAGASDPDVSGAPDTSDTDDPGDTDDSGANGEGDETRVGTGADSSSADSQETSVADPAAAGNIAAATTETTDSEASLPKLRQPNLDSKLRAYATGRRKRAVARVWVKSGGDGRFMVNGREIEIYFTRPVLQMITRQPFAIINQLDHYSVYCTVKGGGLSGQAGAVRHGLARALDQYNPLLHSLLKRGKLLTRDSRMVERKKYGRAKARRSFQFSKR